MRRWDHARVGNEQQLVVWATRLGPEALSGSVAWWSGVTGTAARLAIRAANGSDATNTWS